MSILNQLQQNKGAVSSKLGKELAEKVLKGDKVILKEAVRLCTFNDKNVRAGAAKIIEKVAEKKPELVSPYLKDLFSALESPEAQTRWMIIYAFGYCAKLNPDISVKALPKAKKFLEEESGACLWDRTIIYLGYLGAVSSKNAKHVVPLLEFALEKIPGQTKTILESFERILPVADTGMKNKILKYAKKYSNDKKASVKAKAIKLEKRVNGHYPK
ncbi:HEAT repeat domain-containing protein [Candidatus Micrarchaeota archaeon]|nr:HEAT repeat domain-containing protein [Candidatus Micrarchaeota archaeon]MBU1166579.1 HEAT repeat domain-containing protein [Candidatus Micrarchaeota archaeon]MBU1887289.1 HEAT repeat domain-containing protein [Candidatus Micrarchaeota archaeon]